MKYIYSMISIMLLCQFNSQAQLTTLQERLGYPKETKLLIIHADDLGVSHSENMGSIKAMENGVVNSASIMVPCPWFPEIAAYAAMHPEMDFGLHLTLTSEWDYYKWRPVTSHNEVTGLVDEHSFFHQNWDGLKANATANEVEKELRAQIEMAKSYGINITHLDSHMFSLLIKPEYVAVYKKLGKEYKLPILLDKHWATLLKVSVDSLMSDNTIVIDHVYIADKSNKGMLTAYYTEVLRNLESGVNEILIHTAMNTEEMQAVTRDREVYGAHWRQEDFDFFSGETCKTILKEEGIQLITWKEIKDKLIVN